MESRFQQVKKQMGRYVRLLSLLLCMTPVWGQNPTYPVQVTVNVVPPYSLYLSDYVSGSRDRLVVTLLNRDVQYQAMPVRLRVTIKGDGFALQTRPYATVVPVTLEPNVPFRLSTEDLRPYFDTRNLSAQGLGGNGYLNGGRLPEGMVEFGIEVLEYQTSRLLSQKGTAMAWLTLQKPPQLSLPFQNEEVAWRDPLNLMFQWTPQHSGVSRVEYELIIKELWDNGLAAEAAFAYSPEVFRERVSSTSYLYGALAPALLPGHRYAWAVKVVAKDGIDDVRIFENEGMSTVRTFRIAQQCPRPRQEKATAERGYISLEWEGAPEHLSYLVSYRMKGAEEWADVPSTAPSTMLAGVRAGKTYEYRVAGYCMENIPTYGEVHTITLPSEDTARMRSCGILPPADLSDQTPLDRLEPGDYFMAGDFPVIVREVSGGGGYYTGEGYVGVPFLASAQFKVVFDNVYINSSRKLLRGMARTTYDAKESSVGNLDDIFEGGSQAGNVVTGITKTDLSADFRIGEDAGFYWEEGSKQIDVTDGDGNHIGYIDAGQIAGTEAEAGEGNNGNEPSVFPMTVKDKDGNIYRLEEAPEEGPASEKPAGSNASASSSPSGKKLVAKAVGKVGQELPAGSVNYQHLDTDFGVVEFTDTEGSLYAFDKWEEIYAASYLIKGKYERLGQNYYVPAKLIPFGKSDKVGARFTVTDQRLDPAKVVFRTAKGTEYKVESYDKEKHFYVLTIAGGASNDAQEVYALYPKEGGGYYNLGKLLVLTYAPYEMKVKIVPVANAFTEQQQLEMKLKEIFGRVGIDCSVEFDEVFDYADPTLFDKGSGLLSAYNSRMKALNEAYSQSRPVDPSVSYLFVLLYSGQGGDRNFSGFMPRDKQFGYLFRKDFKDVEKFSIAAAHELSHGRLSLKHPFDISYGLPEKSTANLMDYTDGTHLAKWQWDLIHDPGVVVRLFERDKDAQKVNKDGFKVQETLRIIRLMLTRDADYTFKDVNAEASDIQIGNNKYRKIKIRTVADEEGSSIASSVIRFENLKIELSDKGEAERIRDFIYGKEKDIYGKSLETVVLEDEEITLDVIADRMETILVNLLNRHQYDKLTYTQKVILNIPIIQWKLGYHYGAAFMYFWFNGENRKKIVKKNPGDNYILKIDDQNFSELFLNSSFFQDHLNRTIEEVASGKLYNVPTSLKCLDNIKRSLVAGRNIDIRIPLNYEKSDQDSPDYASFLYSHAVDASSMIDGLNNAIINDDFAYAIGSFAILVSIDGELEIVGKDAGVVMEPRLVYRIWDTFDFSDNQWLGSWNGDVFDATRVGLDIKNVLVYNQDFQDFYELYTGNAPDKGKTPWDFDAVTRNNSLEQVWRGIGYEINSRSLIDHELIK